MKESEQRLHGPDVTALLADVESDADAMLAVAQRLFGTQNTPIYPLDLLAYGAIKRNLSTSQAIGALVKSWNMTCARALLRVHIDTSLRFSAAWLVKDPHQFSAQVLKGVRIDKQVDKNGKRLTDAHLVSIQSSDFPWLPRVYENLSGYIHFSGAHIFDSIAEVKDEESTFAVEVSARDYKFPEQSWAEVLGCCRESSALLGRYLHGYIHTKGLTSDELDRLWKQSPRYEATKNAG
jgi:hypothetical protein